MARDYDYLLKILLVGDSDVGKHEILSGLDDASSERPFCSGNSLNSSEYSMVYKIYLYRNKVKKEYFNLCQQL